LALATRLTGLRTQSRTGIRKIATCTHADRMVCVWWVIDSIEDDTNSM
jgi:hypothetical protein